MAEQEIEIPEVILRTLRRTPGRAYSTPRLVTMVRAAGLRRARTEDVEPILRTLKGAKMIEATDRGWVLPGDPDLD